MKNFRIYCPTYKRGSLCTSHKVFPRNLFSYVTEEHDAKNYEHLGVDIIKIPERKVKNIVTTRNWILDNKKSDYIVMVDDDISKIFRCHSDGKTRTLSDLNEIEIEAQIKNGFIMAEDMGAGMWGVNLQFDPRFYRPHIPINLSFPVLGPFSCILDTTVRYDEQITLKEDYDYFLQMLFKHKRVLRINYLSYLCDHQKMAGGCQIYRTNEKEKENFDLFQKKWGSKLVRKNVGSKDSINPTIKALMGL